MNIYIAGPMTGIKEYNYPAFNQCAAELRANGHKVYNPAEIKPPEPDFAKSLGKSGLWAWYMKKAIVMLLKADVIVLLPGWKNSKGACLERVIAKALLYRIVEHKDMEVIF